VSCRCNSSGCCLASPGLLEGGKVSVSFYDSDRGSYTVAVAWHRAVGRVGGFYGGGVAAVCGRRGVGDRSGGGGGGSAGGVRSGRRSGRTGVRRGPGRMVGSSDRAGGPGGQQGDGPAGGGRAGAVGPRPPLLTSGEARTNRTHCQLRRTGLQDGNKAEGGPLARSPPPIFCRVPVRVPTARAGAWEPAERGRGPCAVAGQGG